MIFVDGSMGTQVRDNSRSFYFTVTFWKIAARILLSGNIQSYHCGFGIWHSLISATYKIRITRVLPPIPTPTPIETIINHCVVRKRANVRSDILLLCTPHYQHTVQHAAQHKHTEKSRLLS